MFLVAFEKSGYKSNQVMERYHCPEINLYCRESRKDKKGYAPIEMGITINGVRKFINCSRKEKPEVFNRKRKPSDLQEYIDLMRTRFNSIINEMLRNGEPLTVESVREFMRSGGYKSYTIGDMITGFLGIKSKEWNNDEITYGQYKKYEYSANVLKEYVGVDREVTVLTPALIRNIYADLKGKYKQETACGYMTRIKAIVRHAIDNGKLSVNPFQGLKIEKGKPELEIITPNELSRIIHHKFDFDRLSKVRDMFVFACGSGLAYIDCTNLQPEDFVWEDGYLTIKKERAKTGNHFCAVLLPFAVDIAKKYNYDFSMLKISNQRINATLKDIQTACNVTSIPSLTFHKARKWYTNHLLNSGVRLETVAKAVGHSSTKTTAKYYSHIEDKTTIKEVSKVI